MGSMGLARLWHGARSDVGIVGDGMDLYDYFLGTYRPRFNFSYSMVCRSNENK